MSETASQIEVQIEKTSQALGSNFQELEHKVKSVTDWRLQFQKSPMTMVGVAFGGGIFLAALLSRPRRCRGNRRGSGSEVGYEPRPHSPWDSIKGALLGVAASRFTDFVADVIPGFHEQIERRRSDKA